MKIITPTELEKIAWEGELDTQIDMFKGPGVKARVAIGEPVSWPAEQAVQSQTGQAWSPPSGDRRYTLVRLALNLYPAGDAHIYYTQATFTAFLRPKNGAQPVIALDLYPQRLTAETRGKFNLTLKPELKFASLLDASLLALGAEIETIQVFPLIQAFGLGEAKPSWQFTGSPANPLLGCQSVYLVVSAPADSGGVRLSLELTARLETRYGPLQLSMPQAARTNLSRLIPG
jgi:hypothetical protein